MTGRYTGHVTFLKGSVMRVKPVMNLGVEHSTLVFEAKLATPAPFLRLVKLILIKFSI